MLKKISISLFDTKFIREKNIQHTCISTRKERKGNDQSIPLQPQHFILPFIFTSLFLYYRFRSKPKPLQKHLQSYSTHSTTLQNVQIFQQKFLILRTRTITTIRCQGSFFQIRQRRFSHVR